jgi:hypothetical protein
MRFGSSHFRFPNTLQGSGSGRGKSIKILAQRDLISLMAGNIPGQFPSSGMARRAVLLRAVSLRDVSLVSSARPMAVRLVRLNKLVKS